VSFTLSEFRKLEKASGSFSIPEYSRDLIMQGVDKKLKGGK